MVYPAPPSGIRYFLDSISAGFPSPAIGFEDAPLDLNELLIHCPAATFFYRVSGDSPGEGLKDGAILIVDRSKPVRAGQLVVADRDGEREVCRMPGVIEGELRVWGKVTAIITRV